MPAVICPAKGGQRHGRRYVRLSVAVLLKSVEVRVRRGANLSFGVNTNEADLNASSATRLPDALAMQTFLGTMGGCAAVGSRPMKHAFEDIVLSQLGRCPCTC